MNIRDNGVCARAGRGELGLLTDEHCDIFHLFVRLYARRVVQSRSESEMRLSRGGVGFVVRCKSQCLRLERGVVVQKRGGRVRSRGKCLRFVLYTGVTRQLSGFDWAFNTRSINHRSV